MERLIFRIDSTAQLADRIILSFGARGGLVKSLALKNAGELVALGLSDVPGIWRVIAVGWLAGHHHDAGAVKVFINDVTRLPTSVTLVTAGDPHADASGRPYTVDTLEGEMADRVFGPSERYQEEDEPSMLAAAEAAHPVLGSGVLYGGLQLEPQEPLFFRRVAGTYAWQCAMTGMSQSSIDGHCREGVVLGLEAPFWVEDGRASQGIFMSSSIAFAYRHGLLAIGDDYDILRRPELDARLRTILDHVNPKALLILPADQEDWPDLEAARRHRHRFGY